MFPHNQLRRRGVMKNRLGQFFIVAVVAAFMVATGTAMAADTIKLGVAGPHSGDLASYGIPTVNAAELVVADINAKGGVFGKQVELLVEDDVCKPEVATNTATKLVGPKTLHVVLGHICSGATKAALGIYKDSNQVVMSPSATNPALTQSGDYPNFFRTIASDDAQARLEVDFALDVLKVKKIAVLHDKGDYGKGLAEFAKGIPGTRAQCRSGSLRGHHPRRRGLLRRCSENQTRQGRGCYFRRVSSGSLQNRHPDAQKENGHHLHLR
jgi:branched-chain amino acid transport system substrate-binding protein